MSSFVHTAKSVLWLVFTSSDLTQAVSSEQTFAKRQDRVHRIALMIRRPLESIDPNSIRVSELYTECRRRHSRGVRESLHGPKPDRERDAARQRAAATRRRETDEARAERCVCDCLRVSSRTHLVRRRNEY